MNKKSTLKMQITFLTFVACISSCIAAAQNQAPPLLVEQLEAQYQLVKMGSDSVGPTVVDPGTVLVIQKGGILGVPRTALAVCPSKYQDGNLHGPSRLCAAMVKQVSSYFQPGTKVYPTKIDVNTKNERISFKIVACDSCNGTNPPSYFKGEISFQFPKKYLEKASVPEIEDVIGQVLAIDNGDTQQNQAAGGGEQTQSQDQAQGNAQAQAEPQTIKLGETPDQVQASLGNPEKIVNVPRTRMVATFSATGAVSGDLAALVILLNMSNGERQCKTGTSCVFANTGAFNAIDHL
jgi:hypothetical protein